MAHPDAGLEPEGRRRGAPQRASIKDGRTSIEEGPSPLQQFSSELRNQLSVVIGFSHALADLAIHGEQDATRAAILIEQAGWCSLGLLQELQRSTSRGFREELPLRVVVAQQSNRIAGLVRPATRRTAGRSLR